MDSNNTNHSHLRCKYCGHFDLYHYADDEDSVGFVECSWCKMMMDIDESLELARKDNL